MWMDDIVAQCPGILTIHDDIFIYDKDDKDHDANLVHYVQCNPKGRPSL